MIASKPKSLNFLEAASVPVVAVTAWNMLFEHAGLTAGEAVLVQGGAGNVGAYAVQLAHNAGAKVVATAGGQDLDFVRSLGADDVVDFQKQPFENAVAGIDVVIDTIGGDVQNRSFSVLKRGGRLISSVSPPDAAKAADCGVRADFFIVSVLHEDLERIARLIDTGALHTDVGVSLPLAQARQAHEMLAGKIPHPRGKIVLEVQA
jgi:NADPH:quinone reductase-like Zn-dependent oxidoreductase